MKRYVICFLGLTVLVLSGGRVSRSQEKPAAASATPSSGPRAEFLAEIDYYEQRYTRLAEAMPAEKYTWRPGEGVRSVGDVYIHIAAANYGVGRALGAAIPAGVDFKSLMAMSADKAKTVQALKDSFAYIKQAVAALNDADADKPQKMFGRQTTLRGSFIVVTGHFGEHLGQSIAYARVNGIVPPWTEEQQKQQQAKPAAKE
ncbi:MAG TPA: DinB family protein [Candidatus Methylomirabilis sp.]|nr:DinB family protein [Candidatus Methylomirabilis sp.]